jgi:hypothetical protein
MKLPSLPPTTEPFLWGAVSGAIALAIVGFTWGGWVSGGTAEKLAAVRGEQATVASLVPICVAQFRRSAKPQASLAELKAAQDWDRTDYVLKAGWATMPGAAGEPSRDVATGCAEAINKLTL